MAVFASGSASASARDAAVVDCGCGHISASQQGLLDRAHFLGGGEEEEAEVFSTPPLGQAGDGEDGITMCSVPFTPTQPSPPSPVSSSSSDSSERRPQKTRICTRKVRCGAKFRTPTPMPAPTPTPMRTPTPTPTPTPMRTPTPSPRPSPELDPLAKMVLMIPTAPPPTISIEEFFELGRSRGVF